MRSRFCTSRRKRHGVESIQRRSLLGKAQLHSDRRLRPTTSWRSSTLQRLNAELGLPVICLLDCDPWGHYIYSVIKQGSMSWRLRANGWRFRRPNSGYSCRRLRTLRPVGRRQTALDDKDIKRAKEIMAYPWFADRRPWKKEIERMLRNGFKMEVESLITKEIPTSPRPTCPNGWLRVISWIDWDRRRQAAMKLRRFRRPFRGASGRTISKHVPSPGVLWTLISPWWASTIRRVTGSPKPVPPAAA